MDFTWDSKRLGRRFSVGFWHSGSVEESSIGTPLDPAKGRLPAGFRGSPTTRRLVALGPNRISPITSGLPLRRVRSSPIRAQFGSDALAPHAGRQRQRSLGHADEPRAWDALRDRRMLRSSKPLRPPSGTYPPEGLRRDMGITPLNPDYPERIDSRSFDESGANTSAQIMLRERKSPPAKAHVVALPKDRKQSFEAMWSSTASLAGPLDYGPAKSSFISRGPNGDDSARLS